MTDTPPMDNPYKGLMPYTEEDARFFFGREDDTQLIVSNLRVSRLTLLYGASGVGKSSVLRAGVLSQLGEMARRRIERPNRPKFVVAAFPRLAVGTDPGGTGWSEDPFRGLHDAIEVAVRNTIATATNRSKVPRFSRNLVASLKSWTRWIDGELLLILDQFEEFFLYHPSSIPQNHFARELARAINQPDIRVNFLISIREDAWSRLDLFKGHIPALFSNYLRVQHLNREAGRRAIRGPVEEYNRQTAHRGEPPVRVEPRLVEAVLDQVRAGQFHSPLTGGEGRSREGSTTEVERIETPYLQLVMWALWEREMHQSSTRLRWRTLERMGRARKIVRTHLDNVMNQLSASERNAAELVFQHLVTPTGSKIAHTIPDLAQLAGQPEAVLKGLFERLSLGTQRILRVVEPSPGQGSTPRYEIFHDVLAQTVLDWRNTVRRRAVEEKLQAAEGLSTGPYHLSTAELERALLTGEKAGQLEDYFGEQTYSELVELVRKIAAVRRTKARRLLIVPDFLGSMLRSPGGPLLWFDPVGVAVGHVRNLALKADTPPPVEAFDLLALGYLKLKLHLAAAGWNVEFHAYDWRQGLGELGDRLSLRIREAPIGSLSVIAHGYGGLVVRAALANPRLRLRQFIMLGTPNGGTYAAVQFLRGTHSVVRRLAVLDQRHTPEDLAGQVFGTFASIYALLPRKQVAEELDLFDPEAWPKTGLQPCEGRLKEARAVTLADAPKDGSWTHILGIHHPTVTALEKAGEGFEYKISAMGDGVVPYSRGVLSGVTSHFVAERHGALTQSQVVIEAILNLLSAGSCALPTTPPEGEPSPTAVPEDSLRIPAFEGRKGTDLSRRETRFILDDFVGAAPSSSERGMPATGMKGKVEATGAVSQDPSGIVVGRTRPCLEVAVLVAPLAAAEANSLGVALFRDLPLCGPVAALDQALGGLISEVSGRQMFRGQLGEVCVLPARRRPVVFEGVILVGLGHVDRLTAGVEERAASILVEAWALSGYEDLALPGLIGGLQGLFGESLRSFLRGLLAGIRRASAQGRTLRRVVLCESDAKFCAQLKTDLLQLAASEFFSDWEFELRDVPSSRSPWMPAPTSRTDPERMVQLLVRMETQSSEWRVQRTFVLPAKSFVTQSEFTFPPLEGEKLLAALGSASFRSADVQKLGGQLAEIGFSKETQGLARLEGREVPLVISHDRSAGQLPWECLRLGDTYPALGAGLCRAFLTDVLRAGKSSHQRSQDPVLNVLLVTNPTEDLDGAELERERMLVVLNEIPSIRFRELRRSEATRTAVRWGLSSGEYDLVYFAGHVFVDPEHRARCGVLCAGQEVLSGVDLAGLGSTPGVVWVAACEAARIRRGTRVLNDAISRIPNSPQDVLQVAETFVRSGIPNFVGAAWPVSDLASEVFNRSAFSRLSKGETLAGALAAGRRAVYGHQSIDWVAYFHVGSPTFALKAPPEGSASSSSPNRSPSSGSLTTPADRRTAQTRKRVRATEVHPKRSPKR